MTKQEAQFSRGGFPLCLKPRASGRAFTGLLKKALAQSLAYVGNQIRFLGGNSPAVAPVSSSSLVHRSWKGGREGRA